MLGLTKNSLTYGARLIRILFVSLFIAASNPIDELWDLILRRAPNR